MEAVVRARGLRKQYGDFEAVRGIDFDVPRGRCTGLLGPNGAGKTTTLRMILGLAPVDGGTLDVFGAPVGPRAEALRRRIGVVPQMDNLDPDFTVEENLRVYARYFGLRGPAVAARIAELLEFMGLVDRRPALIATLSGGMKRRLTIARALLQDPELIVLDEPTTGLDPQARHMIWGRLHDLVRAGKTLLLTTHYMEEAERLCHDIAVMDRGVILDRGSPADLLRRHVEPEVVELRGARFDVAALAATVPGVRAEHFGDTWYCYAADPAPLVAAFEPHLDVRLLRRPANVEDVFLSLTGRELRD